MIGGVDALTIITTSSAILKLYNYMCQWSWREFHLAYVLVELGCKLFLLHVNFVFAKLPAFPVELVHEMFV